MCKAFKLIENDQRQNDFWQIVPAVSPVAVGEQPAFPKHQLLLQPLSLRRSDAKPTSNNGRGTNGKWRQVFGLSDLLQTPVERWNLDTWSRWNHPHIHQRCHLSILARGLWQRAPHRDSANFWYICIYYFTFYDNEECFGDCVRLVLLLPHYIDCCTGSDGLRWGSLQAQKSSYWGLVLQDTKISRLLHNA